MKVNVSAQADRDFCDIVDDLAMDNPAAAADLNAQFAQRLSQLERLPLMGRQRSDIGDGLRGLLVSPYVVFYRVINDEIMIVRVLHGRRDLQSTMVEKP